MSEGMSYCRRIPRADPHRVRQYGVDCVSRGKAVWSVAIPPSSGKVLACQAREDASTESASEPQLKRHVGVVGLLFASVGSIIGSGWLFGALNASQEAGPAALISWALGGFLILLIALVYAELGVMFPLSGGVVRFPQMAFGHLASFTSGWITYVAVATTAPIEVEAALQYGTKYAPFTTSTPSTASPCTP